MVIDMKEEDMQVIMKAVSMVLKPRLKKLDDEIKDLLFFIEDLQDRVSILESRLDKVEESHE